MNYLLKSKPKHEHRGKIISVIVIFCLLTLSGFLFPNAIRTTFYAVSTPLWKISGGLTKPFVKIKDFFISKNSLIESNLALKEELAGVRLKEIDYDILSKENQDLKDELGRKGSSSTITSRVLSKPPRSPYDTFVIDAGSSEGVVLGNKVYTGNNIIIGLVTNVTPHTSLVRLFSSSGEKQEASILRTGESFIVTGRGGANLEVEVPKDTDILIGDSFMYPDFSTSAIGIVYYIDENSQSSFKSVYLRIPGNVFSSKFVYIEKNQ